MSKIEWTDITINPIRGCTKKSAGCAHCYAEKMAFRQKHMWRGKNKRLFDAYNPLTDDKGKWTGKVTFDPQALDVLRTMKKPRNIFLNSMGDLFHKDVPFEWLDKLFWTIACHAQWNNPRIREYHHTFMILTKCPERMAEYLSLEEDKRRDWFNRLVRSGHIRDEPYLPNLWLGATCEDQATLDERIPYLVKTPAAVRFLSLEPLLERVDISGWLETFNPPNWIILGCESGVKRRPCKIEWIDNLAHQGMEAGIPVFVKQLDIGGKVVKDWDDPLFPEHLKIREFPNG
jgi:protein gp37